MATAKGKAKMIISQISNTTGLPILRLSTSIKMKHIASKGQGHTQGITLLILTHFHKK